MRRNRQVVPEAREALERMKLEIADELGASRSEGDKGALSAGEKCIVGGELVRRMIRHAENNMKR